MQSSENLHKLKDIANNRLDPYNTTIWLLLVNVINIVMYIACNNYLKGIPKIVYFIVLTIGILAAISNNDIKYAYRYQKMQSVLLTFIMVVFPVGVFISLTAMRGSDRISYDLFRVGLVLLTEGIILTIVSILRAIIRIKNGCYKEGGSGLCNYTEPSLYNTISIAFPVVIIITKFIPVLLTKDAEDVPVVALVFAAAVIHNIIAITLPEVCMYMYCKLKYYDFRVDMPDITKCPLPKVNE